MRVRLVHLEDDEVDRELVARTLRGEGIDCVVVEAECREEFDRALDDPPDLIKLGTAVKRALREAEERRHRASAETALRHLNAQLEARIIERTRDLVTANEDLKRARLAADRANLAKSEFLARMSHDLRTPLNAIIGFAQLLNLDGLPADQIDSINHILRGGEHLLSLINEELDISRIESGDLTLSLEPVSVIEAVDRVASPAAVVIAEYQGSVLYIEDNASNVVLMERVLARRPGVRLTHAPDGRSGLETLRGARPDLVILDLHLSDMPGEEVLRQIWSDPATRTVPIAVLSADATGRSQRRLRGSGAVAYLTKPFDIAEVLRLVDEIVGGTQATVR
jgi:CheY-like chemotaxis protein